MILDHPLIGQQAFYPRPTSLKPTLVVDVPGAELGCYHFHRYPDAGTLLHFHGNGELAADYAEDYAELFLDMGVNVCFAEYRGYGASTGTPGLGAMLGDGVAIVEALGIAPERIVVFGRSLGSLYAVELAHRLPNLAGVILESGIADVLWFVNKRIATVDELPFAYSELLTEIRVHFDIKTSLNHYPGKLLILHAAHDHLVDRTHGERLHAWGANPTKKLVMFPSGNHNDIFSVNYSEYLREVKACLDSTGITRSQN